jgi:hypothetical protein
MIGLNGVPSELPGDVLPVIGGPDDKPGEEKVRLDSTVTETLP